MRDFYFDNGDACPWYLKRLMDQDMVHLTVQDLSDPERYDDMEGEGERGVSSDFVCFLLTPSVLRQMGLNPEGLYTLRGYKEKAMDLIRSISPAEIRNSAGTFRKRIQGFFNRTLDLLFRSSSLDEAKSLVREILDLLGVDYPLGEVDVQEVLLYNTSYLSYIKVFYTLGRFDPEEFRYENLNSFYVKKVPQPNLWDYKEFLEAGADFIASAFFESFLVLKEDGPSNTRWSILYDEALARLSLVDLLITKVPDVSVRNKNKEVWVLNTHDFFYFILRQKLISLAGEIPLGLREEFLNFHLPEEVQRKLSPRVVYRPWKKQ